MPPFEDFDLTEFLSGLFDAILTFLVDFLSGALGTPIG